MGPAGPAGPTGASVVSAVLTPGDPNCPEGGSSFTTTTGTSFACNGAPGPTGPAGDPIQVATNAGLTGDGTSASPLAVDFAGSGTANTAARSDHDHAAPLGESRAKPATSCADLLVARPTAPDGLYWLEPTSAPSAFRAYCDMTTDGGGWTLVWSNLRGGRGKPVTEIQWSTAINTLPVYAGALVPDPEAFTVFTGLKHWAPLAPNATLRYSWANDYGSPIDQSYKCTFAFTGTNYILGLIGCSQLVGATVPGLFSLHNNRPFSTYDRDNDGDSVNCAATYTQSPWWYAGCWNGSINGGGEASESGHYNGAYWSGSAVAWGANAGTGAGNGWIFVR